jgi:hypothetical protein
VRKRGPKTALILPGPWICTQIEKNWNRRRYVPRVYGLGDVTSILEEHRMRQARALLTSLTRELETFVPTSAYRDASDAITSHGFVLLLGEPVCGKATIAAMLCMTALDNWPCDVMMVALISQSPAGVKACSGQTAALALVCSIFRVLGDREEWLRCTPTFG